MQAERWGSRFNPLRCEARTTSMAHSRRRESSGRVPMITVEDPLTITYRKRITDFATAQHLPSLHGQSEFVEAGGLMSYGANLADILRRAAGYVDKILKGA